MAKKLARQVIVLECTVCKVKNYTSSKNINNTKEKLELKRHCSNCKKHTIHKEVKK